MDSLIGFYLLPQYGNVVIGAHQGIQGVHSFPRISTSVSTSADEFTVDFLSRIHQNSSHTILVLSFEKTQRTWMTETVRMITRDQQSNTYAINEISTPL